MQRFQRFVEWYLGVPPAEPGEGTAWNFSYRTPWPAWLPEWAVLLLALGILAYVVFIYSRDAIAASLRLRLTLIHLRLATVAVLLLFLGELTLSIDLTGLPIVAVLVDVSASMGLEDEYRDESADAAVRQLMAEAGSTQRTRLNLAKEILTRENGRFLKQLGQKHKLRIYQFSETAAPLGKSEYLEDDEIDGLIPLLRALTAEGEQTRPGPAVQKVLGDLRGAPPSAVILLTDGITSTRDADRLTGVIDLALDKLVPIYCIGIGSEEPARDVQLYDLLVDEVAFVDDPVNFAAKLKAYGFDGEMLHVTLREKGSSEILAQKQLPAPADGQPLKLELTYAAPIAGEFDYSLEVVPSPRETNQDNNRETRHVSVRQEKTRVLLADSEPRFEFRYLKHLLEREASIELHTVLQSADPEYAMEDRTALARFPVKREDLLRFDVVIFGDLNLGFLSPSILENLRDFVRDAGGGLIAVAGTKHNPLSYRGTPLEIMLPIGLTGAKAPPADSSITDSFQPVLTIEGRKGTNIFRFAPSEEESFEIWQNLEELIWLFEAPELKTGAVVFAEHPSRMGTQRRLPVIAMQRFGAGKVLFHATDELWRWRFRVGDLYYGRYWIQAIRYLSRSKLLGRDRTADLSADRLVYQRGDTVELRVRFLDDRLVPTGDDEVAVMIERAGDVPRRVALHRLPEAPTVFEGRFSRPADGTYHAWVVAPSFNEAPPSTDFRIEAPRRELEKRGLDRAELMQTAQATHGKFYPLNEAQQLPVDIPEGKPVPLETQDPILLWNRWEILILFSLLLLAEWLLRKRCRLI